MENAAYKVYGYRWVVQVAFMLVVVVNQLLWITFAPITSTAAGFYHVSDLEIGLLSLSFMAVFIVMSIPASWVIDSRGLRLGVGIGAVLTAVFGLLRGLAGASYNLVLISQIGIAIGQPFVLNAITKVAARWFPMQERATASGLGSLAIYVGILMGLALTPYLTSALGIPGMLQVYGAFSVVAALAFAILIRERPPTPPCPPEQEARSLVLDGLRETIRKGAFIRLMIVFFVGLGVFNAVTTWIENIVGPRGFSSEQAGIIGGVMIVGGMVGALVLPSLSDRYRKRVPFIVGSLIGALVGLIGLTLAGGYGLLLASSFLLGASLLSAGPIGFQYGAEIAYPAPEGTSNGLLLLMGQISGIAFILGMDALKSPTTGLMTTSLWILIGFVGLSVLLAATLKESALIQEAKSS
ncbi:MAG TPA: MFS transporter [Anaerolineales bacterium]|nr:MFS transporter [Anaerolineales bacterium]